MPIFSLAQETCCSCRVGSTMMAEEGAQGPAPDGGGEQLRQAARMLPSVLDERQRRLFAGLQSLRLGRGGDVRVARWLGTSPETVAWGRRQLLRGDVATDRVRKPLARQAPR